jgi:hypothetical protein
MMGCEPLKLVELKRQSRVPGQPNSCSEWLGFAKWLGLSGRYMQPQGMIFEEMAPI